MHDLDNPYAAPQTELKGAPTHAQLGDLRKVKVGLDMIYFGLLVAFPAITLLAIEIVPAALRLPLKIVAAIGLTSVYLGPFLCHAMPKGCRGKGLVVACTSLQGLGTLPLLRGFNLAAETGFPRLAFGGVCMLIALLCFVGFLRQLSAYLDRKRLQQTIDYLLIAFILSFSGFAGIALRAAATARGLTEGPLVVLSLFVLLPCGGCTFMVLAFLRRALSHPKLETRASTTQA